MNLNTDPRGYRFKDSSWINYCTSLYLMAGKKAYNYCQANGKGIYPSSRTIKRRIEKSFPLIPPGQINAKYLADYLKRQNLPLTVAIAEDPLQL